LDKKNGVRPRLLTLKEAAVYLGRSVDSVRELLYQQELRCIQRGPRSKIWLDRHELDEWIEQNLRFM